MKDREELVINVCGLSASGKSTIIQMIQEMLVKEGFNIDTRYNDEPIPTTKGLIDRKESIRLMNKKITINEVQAIKNIRQYETH
jgi:uridine kinase